MDALFYAFSAGNSTAAASHHVGLPGAFPLESWKPSLRMLALFALFKRFTPAVSVGFDILLPVYLLLSCTWNSRRFLLSFVCYLMQEKPQVHSQVTSFPPFSSAPIFLLWGGLRFKAYLPWSVSDSNKIILKLPFESILSSFC